jgi:ferredoxin
MDRLSAITRRIAEIEPTSNESSAPTRRLETNSDAKTGLAKISAVLDEERCIDCGVCIDLCPEEAISMRSDYTVVIDPSRCTACGSCIDGCPNEAISLSETAPRSAS